MAASIEWSVAGSRVDLAPAGRSFDRSRISASLQNPLVIATRQVLLEHLAYPSGCGRQSDLTVKQSVLSSLTNTPSFDGVLLVLFTVAAGDESGDVVNGMPSGFALTVRSASKQTLPREPAIICFILTFSLQPDNWRISSIHRRPFGIVLKVVYRSSGICDDRLRHCFKIFTHLLAGEAF
jgi:hypothetical protein